MIFDGSFENLRTEIGRISQRSFLYGAPRGISGGSRNYLKKILNAGVTNGR